MTTYYSWTRRKVCTVCQQPFSTNGGNLTACAVCRHKPEYVQKRKERAARLHKLWLAREDSRKRRDATTGLETVNTARLSPDPEPPNRADGEMLRDGRADRG